MDTQLLFNLGLLLFFAILGGLIATRFKQPFVLGLLLVGTLIGPNLLGIIHDTDLINVFIDFGTILFLFVTGLEFSLNKILKLGMKPLIVVLFKVGIMFFSGFIMMTVLGFDVITATFAAVMISFSSTAIITNILTQKNLINREEVPLLRSTLILEDIFLIFALIFFTSLKASSKLVMINSIEHVLISLAILLICYVVLSRYAEKIISWVHKNTPDDTTLFTSLLFCAAFAYLAYLLKLSPSAGAFLAGSIISNFKESKSFHNSVKPYIYIFSAFFFISIGTLINLKVVLEHIWIILILILTMILGLTIGIGIITRIFANFSKESSVFGTFIMIPPAVSSLILARESISYGVTLDLISIVSVIILVMSALMSILSTRTNFLVNHMNNFNSKDSRINKTITSIASYFETLFNELKVDNVHTDRLKYSFSKVWMKIFIFLGTSIVLKEILEWLFINKTAFYIGIIAGITILIYELIIICAEGKQTYLAIIKLISIIDGGTKTKRIHEATKNLFIAIGLILAGIYSPLLFFMFKLHSIYIFVSILLILIGIGYFKLAGDKLHRFEYYEQKYTYRKIYL